MYSVYWGTACFSGRIFCVYDCVDRAYMHISKLHGIN